MSKRAGILALARPITKWPLIGLAGLVVLTLLGGRIYQVVSESRDLERYPPPGELIAVDGHLVHIHCIGQGTPTVIFELGIGSASAAWAEVHRQVSQFTRACAYDRPGLGYSEPTDQATRAADVASRLRELLRAAEIEDDLILVGWSAGGVYIREYQRRYPDKVRAMLFVDSSHEQQANRTPQRFGSGSDPTLQIAKHLAPFGIVRMSGILDRRIEASGASAELKARLKAIYRQSHILRTVSRESDAFNADINATRPPTQIGDLPLIVLTRGKPADVSEQQYWEATNRLQLELTKLSTRGKQIIASESGHHIHVDQPELVIESVRELVQLVRDEREID